MIGTNSDLDKAKRWLQGILNDDFDKYDIEHRYDSRLSLEENKTIMRKQLGPLMKEWNKEKFDQAKAEMEEYKYQKTQTAKKMRKVEEQEAEEFNTEIRSEESEGKKRDIDSYYRKLNRAVGKVCQGYSNIAFIKGRGGLGKSRNIRRILQENDMEFVEVTGAVTQAYLYQLIYDNNGKIIWFKDVANLLSTLGCLPFDTKIRTDKGLKEIRHIDPTKDKVLSWNFEKQKQEYKRFQKWETGMKNIVKIKANGKTIQCSPTHKWIIKRQDGKIIEKMAKDLNTKDVLLRINTTGG